VPVNDDDDDYIQMQYLV